MVWSVPRVKHSVGSLAATRRTSVTRVFKTLSASCVGMRYCASAEISIRTPRACWRIVSVVGALVTNRMERLTRDEDLHDLVPSAAFSSPPILPLLRRYLRIRSVISSASSVPKRRACCHNATPLTPGPKGWPCSTPMSPVVMYLKLARGSVVRVCPKVFERTECFLLVEGNGRGDIPDLLMLLLALASQSQ